MTEPRDPAGGADPALVALLRGDRTMPAPAESRTRVGAKLAAVGIPLGSATGGHAGAHPSGLRWKLATAGGKGLTVAAFVAGAAVGAGAHAALTRPPEPRIVYVDRVTPAVAPVLTPAPERAAVEDVAPVPDAGHEAHVSPGETPPPTVRAPRPSPGPVGSGAGSQLEAERLLLDEARSALNHGDPDTTLGILDRHARTFGRAVLAEEREALRVEALVRAGRYDDARAAAKAFRERFPNSMLEGAVEAATGTIP